MAGVVEQKSGLVRSKLSEAGKRNGLINTRSLVAESRDGLVSVYPAPQYQSCRVVGSVAPAGPDGARNEPLQQLLDPSTLQQSVESRYRPNLILYSESVLRPWGDGVAADCCETTFIEDRSPTKESLEYPDGKFIDLSPEDIKIHTLSYDVEEEEEFQELEVRAYVCHRPSGVGCGALGGREPGRRKSGHEDSEQKCKETTASWAPFTQNLCERYRDGEGGEVWDLGLQRKFCLGDTRSRPSGWD